MKIRTRLTFQFSAIVALIIALLLLAVYYSFSEYRERDFQDRLKRKGLTTANLLFDLAEVDSAALILITNKSRTGLLERDIVIVDSIGKVLYSFSDDTSHFFPPLSLIEKLKLAGQLTIGFEGKEGFAQVYKLPMETKKYFVFVLAFDKYGFDKLKFLRLNFIIGFLICVGFTIWAGWFYAGGALRPFSRMISQVNEITASRLHTKIDEGNSKDEFGLLSSTFNNLIERLRVSFHMQRSLISNVSHELRTPLTSLSAQVEVALMKERSTKEYKDILLSIKEDLIFITSLSNSIIELASISNDSFVLRKELLRLDDIIFAAREYFMKSNPDSKVIIAFADSVSAAELMQVNGNRHLLTVAFANIIENSVKYSQNKTSEVFIHHSDGKLKLDFLDNGIGIPNTEIQNIYNPFFRASNVHSINGHGLGLALVKRIVELHNYSIQIESQNGKGTKVSITFNN